VLIVLDGVANKQKTFVWKKEDSIKHLILLARNIIGVIDKKQKKTFKGIDKHIIYKILAFSL